VGILEEGVRDERAIAHDAKSTASGSTTQAITLISRDELGTRVGLREVPR
jgi:hypothetical protein